MTREQRIADKLNTEFTPLVLNIENESHKHHSGKGAESHFKVTLVSEKFAGKRTIQRHQAIYAALASEFDSGLYALALHTFTPAEWEENKGEVPPSPTCAGVGL